MLNIKAMAIGGAVIASLAFTSGWVVNGWRHSASELGKLQASYADTLDRMKGVAAALEAGNTRQNEIREQTATSARKVREYVEANNSCSFSADDRRLFIDAHPDYQFAE